MSDSKPMKHWLTLEGDSEVTSDDGGVRMVDEGDVVNLYLRSDYAAGPDLLKVLEAVDIALGNDPRWKVSDLRLHTIRPMIEKAKTGKTKEMDARSVTARAMVQAVDAPKIIEEPDAVPADTIRITVEGGLIQDIERGLGTEGVAVQVRDFDTEGAEEQDLSRNAKGEEFIASEW